MPEVVVGTLIGSALALLHAPKQLRRKCQTLSNFLERLRNEIPKMKKHNGNELDEMESVMTDLLEAIETFGLQRKGKFSGITLFFSARQTVDDLDDYHSRLVEILETFRLRHGNSLGSAVQNVDATMQNVERALENLRQNQEKDNREDLKEDRGAVQQAMRQETDPEVRDLLEASKDMDDEEFDNALRTAGNMNRMMVSIATRSQIEELALQANIAQTELDVDEQDVLGTGSFGEVVAGTYKGRKVAVRRSIDMSLLSFKAQDDLRKETERWKDLKHKNIVCLVGTGIYNNLFCLVMEQCDMSLFELLYKWQETMELDSAEAIARGIARGLAYLHSENLIHRDLKPMNVMLSYDLGRVKLSDFGLLKTKEEYATNTKTSSAKGIWVYRAPEVLEEPAKWTTRADMYSFGLVLWEMLHREIPWGANISLAALIRKTARGERPALSENLAVQPWYIPLVEACWSQEAKKRPTAQEALSISEKKSTSRRSTEIVKSLLSFVESGRKSLARPVPVRPSVPREKASSEPHVTMPQGAPTEDDVARAVQEMTNGNFEGGLKLLLACIESENIIWTRDTKAVRTLRKEAWRLNAIPLLLANAKSASSCTVRDCLNTLAFIMSHEEMEACGKAVAELGGDAVVMEVMDTFHHDPDVQVAATFTLLCMAENAYNKVSLMTLGAAERVVDAMRTHHSNADVQLYACAALMSLAANTDHLGSLTTLGAAERIVEAMQRHPTNAGVQVYACSALGNFALIDDNQLSLMKLGAAERIVEAMRTHKTNADVQEKACTALVNLAVNLAANLEIGVSLMQLGAVECIVEAMRIHPTNADLQLFACIGLFNLSFAANGKAALCAVGAKEVAKRAKVRHRSNSEVVTEANALLRRLS